LKVYSYSGIVPDQLPWNLDICSTCPPSGNAQHLKSRHPFVPTTQQLISSSDNKNAVLCADHWCNAEWLGNITRTSTFIPDVGTQRDVELFGRSTL